MVLAPPPDLPPALTTPNPGVDSIVVDTIEQ